MLILLPLITADYLTYRILYPQQKSLELEKIFRRKSAPVRAKFGQDTHLCARHFKGNRGKKERGILAIWGEFSVDNKLLKIAELALERGWDLLYYQGNCSRRRSLRIRTKLDEFQRVKRQVNRLFPELRGQTYLLLGSGIGGDIALSCAAKCFRDSERRASIVLNPLGNIRDYLKMKLSHLPLPEAFSDYLFQRLSRTDRLSFRRDNPFYLTRGELSETPVLILHKNPKNRRWSEYCSKLKRCQLLPDLFPANGKNPPPSYLFQIEKFLSNLGS